MHQHVGAIEFDLRLPGLQSRKAKRAVPKPVIEGAHRRYRVAASEVGAHDDWQRSILGFAAVGGEFRQVDDVLDEVERFVWSFPEVEVLEVTRTWIDRDA